MKERPLIFSSPMVRALLAGTKTQTRRVVKSFPCNEHGVASLKEEDGLPLHVSSQCAHLCPYGVPGDRLWVRETHMQPHDGGIGAPVFYRADYPACVPADYENVPDVGDVRWRSSMFMPRWASRITLELTGVRVEQLQGISHEDALAEGMKMPSQSAGMHPLPQVQYRELWDSLNAKRAPWSSNPWVWVLSFRRVTQ